MVIILSEAKKERVKRGHTWCKKLIKGAVCVLGLSLFKKPHLTLTLPPRVVRQCVLPFSIVYIFFQYGVIQLWVLTLWCNLEYYSVPPVLVILAFSQASGKPSEDD